MACVPSWHSATTSMSCCPSSSIREPLARERLVVGDYDARGAVVARSCHADRRRSPAATAPSDRGSRCGRRGPARRRRSRAGTRHRRGSRAGRACWRGRCRCAAARAPRRSARRRRRGPRARGAPFWRRDAICDRRQDRCAATTPCWIAFSTSGCRISRGTSASSVSGSMSKRTVRRSWKRVCSISRYFCRNSSSSCSGTRCGARAVEGEPQQVAQAADHPVGGIGAAVHQRRDRVERVEQEVRVQLRLQRPQPRLGQLRFELSRVQRPRLRLPVIRKGVAQADNRRVGHQRPVHVRQEEALAEGAPAQGRRLDHPRPQRGTHREHQQRSGALRT